MGLQGHIRQTHAVQLLGCIPENMLHVPSYSQASISLALELLPSDHHLGLALCCYVSHGEIVTAVCGKKGMLFLMTNVWVSGYS